MTIDNGEGKYLQIGKILQREHLFCVIKLGIEWVLFEPAQSEKIPVLLRLKIVLLLVYWKELHPGSSFKAKKFMLL